MKLLTKPDFNEEKKIWEKDFQYVIGLDEVGRGCFAGPVTIGAVIFSKDSKIDDLDGINDSKLVKPLKRLKLTKLIKEKAIFSTIITIPVSVINRKGITKATQIAFRRAIQQARKEISINIYVLIDGFHIKFIKGVGLKNQKGIIKGDQKSLSIAAASIIAKVHRDKLMKNLDKKYPEYNFAKNKGYGTKEHQEAIKKYGFSKIHRSSFDLLKFTEGF